MKKRALVLASGGARGAYQVGMLQELVVKRGLDFQIIRGVSVGALNAAFLAQAPIKGNSLAELKKRVQTLHKMWVSEIKGNHSVYAERGGYLGVVAGADSLYSLQPLRRLMEKHIKVEALRNSGRNFAVGTVSLVSGEYHEWAPKERDFHDKLLASAAIPFVFPYVDLKKAEDVLVDGGVRNITPLRSAFAPEPDEIYILLTSRVIREDGKLPRSAVQKHTYEQWDDNWLGTKVNGLDVLKRTVDILTDEVYLDDIRGALNWNKVAQNIGTLEEASKGHDLPAGVSQAIAQIAKTLKEVEKRAVRIFVLAPREWFGDENKSTEFSPKLIREAIEHGRQVAADPSLWAWPPRDE